MNPDMPDIVRLQDMTWHLKRYARRQRKMDSLDAVLIMASRIRRMRKAQRKALRYHFGHDPLEMEWSPELSRACRFVGWNRWIPEDKEAPHADASPVYLAGAIDGVTRDIAEKWRLEAGLTLRNAPYHCDIYNPLETTGTPEGIIAKNQQMLFSSQAVLAELHLPALHYGTTCEIEQAVSFGLPVVAWMKNVVPPLYLMRHKVVVVCREMAEAFDAAFALASERLKRRRAG